MNAPDPAPPAKPWNMHILQLRAEVLRLTRERDEALDFIHLLSVQEFASGIKLRAMAMTFEDKARRALEGREGT